MQNNKNLMLLMVSSMVLFIAWSQLMRWLHPPKPKPAPSATESRWPFASLPKKDQERLAAQLTIASLVGSAGTEPAGALAEAALLGRYLPQPDPWPWTRAPRTVQTAVVGQLALAASSSSGMGGVARLASDLAVMSQHPPLPRKRVALERDDIVLGDDSSFLKVELTNKGAAVRRVVLNKFQGADCYGLPVWKDKAKKLPGPLELVPKYRIRERFELEQPPDYEIIYDDGRDGRPFDPLYHYSLFHYGSPEDEHPLTTLGDELWTVVTDERKPGMPRQEVSFVAEVPGQVRITKTYALAASDYHIGLSIKVQSLRPKGPEPQKFRYQLAGARDLPLEGVWYTYTYRNALVGWVDNKGDWRGLETSQQLAHWQGGDRYERERLQGVPGASGGSGRTIRYAGVAVQFFAAVVAIPEKEQQPTGRDNFVDWVRATMEGPPNKQMPFLEDFTVRLVSEPLTLPPGAADQPGEAVEHRYVLYHGPVKVSQLGYLKGGALVDPELVNTYENKLRLYTLTDFHSPGWMGEFGSKIGMTSLIIYFTNVMHWLLDKLHLLLPIYGLNIIMLTVVVRGLMFPISRRQALANQKMQEKMGKLAPEVKKLQEKYRDDPAALNQARTQLYLEHGINPLGAMGGCFLIFAQMPIFLGLYYCLQESIFFRLESFLWMRNLAAPDMLFWWSEKIPMLSEPNQLGGLLYLGPYFNLLPVIAVALMLVQQQLMTPPPTDEQQAMQMKMMKYMMIFFGFMFYKVAAGLCIYFIASSIWGVSERKLLPKSKPSKEEEPPTGRSGSGGSSGSSKPRGPRRADGGDGFGRKMRDWWNDLLRDAAKQQQARRDDRGGEAKKKKKQR